jgi:hypothetical protein
MPSTRLQRLKKKHLDLAPRERVIVGLERVQSRLRCPDSRAFAGSLVAQFKTKGFLTNTQWYYAKNLLTRPSDKLPKKKPSSIYVFEAAAAIKIGMSREVPERLKAIQTSNPELVELKFTYEVGCRVNTRSIERRLHRACEKHRLHGEWFEPEAFEIVKNFITKLEAKEAKRRAKNEATAS